uniref:Uncharacterized protein n=1 Tax=Geladintestivirus 1 TaxID=3233133 RepID=A0AAU8MHM4_9CAUD
MDNILLFIPIFIFLYIKSNIIIINIFFNL